MRNIWNWIEDNAGPIAVTIAILGGFAAIIQVSVVRPMHQGFDAVNQRIDDQIKYINERFDAVDQRFDDQNRAINQRFDDQNRSINQRFDDQNKLIAQRFDAQDRRIDALTEQLQTVDAPSP